MPRVLSKIPTLSKRDLERFWSKVEKTEGCWLFHSSLTRGYGRFGIGDDRIFLAHRVSYFIARNVDPLGALVCHECDNPQCVRPDHLFLGTDGDNIRDMFQKKRGRPKGGVYPRGEKHHLAKLNPELIAEMRRLNEDGVSLRELERRYGVTRPAIKNALAGRTWRHLGEGSAQIPAQGQRSDEAESA